MISDPLAVGCKQELGLKDYARMDGWVLFPLEASTDSAAASESDGDEPSGSSDQPAAQSSADEQPQPAAEAAFPDVEEDAESPAEADADRVQASGADPEAEAAAAEEPDDADERLASDEVCHYCFRAVSQRPGCRLYPSVIVRG